MKVNEIFEGIQGEGKYIGTPALFIRLSGCTRNCEFCDTKYHNTGKEMTREHIIQLVEATNLDTIIWTGGEPTLQIEEIYKVVEATKHIMHHHLETNGDIIVDYTQFFYTSFSPKELIVLKNILQVTQFIYQHLDFDIKIVTDLDMNSNMLKVKSNRIMLMPLSMNDEKIDKEIMRNVWDYCIIKGIRFCPRIHRMIHGNERGK